MVNVPDFPKSPGKPAFRVITRYLNKRRSENKDPVQEVDLENASDVRERFGCLVQPWFYEEKPRWPFLGTMEAIDLSTGESVGFGGMVRVQSPRIGTMYLWRGSLFGDSFEKYLHIDGSARTPEEAREYLQAHQDLLGEFLCGAMDKLEELRREIQDAEDGINYVRPLIENLHDIGFYAAIE
jgi:hypothetical protein